MQIDNNVGDIDIIGSWVEIGMVMTAVIAGVILAIPIIKHIYSKNKKNKHIWTEGACSKSFVNRHTKIHEYLTELRVLTDSGRTSIVQFHNGGYFLDGASIKRFSLTHESCRSGISETRQERQDVLLTMFGEMLEFVSSNNSTPILTSELSDCHYKRHLETNNVIMFSIIPIRSSDGMNVIGALSVEWCSWVKADGVIFDDVIERIEEKRRYIEAELAIQNT